MLSKIDFPLLNLSGAEKYFIFGGIKYINTLIIYELCRINDTKNRSHNKVQPVFAYFILIISESFTCFYTLAAFLHSITACAAASLACGTLYGEQDT